MTALSMNDLRRFEVAPGTLTMWWLGQAGFIVKSPQGRLVVIDPYLSDSCQALGAQNGLNFARRVPVPMAPQELVGVDALVLTHSHQDHLDPETIGPYRAAGGAGPYIAPAETIDKLRSLGIPPEQMHMTWPNKVITIGDLLIRATFAIPFAGDDLTHVGYLVMLRAGPRFYFTGDTAYHEILGASVAEHRPDVLVAVINGAFRNLSAAEAATLARQLDPRVVIPCHYDLFPDNQQPPQMLRTNLHILGLGERYAQLEHAQPFTFSAPPTT